MLYAIMQLITGKRVFGYECSLTNKCYGTMFENVSKVIKVHDFFYFRIIPFFVRTI